MGTKPNLGRVRRTRDDIGAHGKGNGIGIVGRALRQQEEQSGLVSA
jgi:hypothetical protein